MGPRRQHRRLRRTIEPTKQGPKPPRTPPRPRGPDPQVHHRPVHQQPQRTRPPAGQNPDQDLRLPPLHHRSPSLAPCARLHLHRPQTRRRRPHRPPRRHHRKPLATDTISPRDLNGYPSASATPTFGLAKRSGKVHDRLTRRLRRRRDHGLTGGWSSWPLMESDVDYGGNSMGVNLVTRVRNFYIQNCSFTATDHDVQDSIGHRPDRHQQRRRVADLGDICASSPRAATKARRS